eukprot:1158711-Pelagomonas_calceolata.AAC.3
MAQLAVFLSTTGSSIGDTRGMGMHARMYTHTYTHHTHTHTCTHAPQAVPLPRSRPVSIPFRYVNTVWRAIVDQQAWVDTPQVAPITQHRFLHLPCRHAHTICIPSVQLHGAEMPCLRDFLCSLVRSSDAFEPTLFCPIGGAYLCP